MCFTPDQVKIRMAVILMLEISTKLKAPEPATQLMKKLHIQALF